MKRYDEYKYYRICKCGFIEWEKYFMFNSLCPKCGICEKEIPPKVKARKVYSRLFFPKLSLQIKRADDTTTEIALKDHYTVDDQPEAAK